VIYSYTSGRYFFKIRGNRENAMQSPRRRRVQRASRVNSDVMYLVWCIYVNIV